MTGRPPAPLSWLAGLLAVYLLAPLLAGVQQAGLADWHSVDVGALLACLRDLDRQRHHCDGPSSDSAAFRSAMCWREFPAAPSVALGVRGPTPAGIAAARQRSAAVVSLGDSAPLGRLTSGRIDGVPSLASCSLEVFVAAPFLIIAARSAFAAIDPVLEGVAATLGRGPLAMFFRVSLPIARPAILSGLLLAWLRAFGEFGATVMVAYHPYSLPIYTYVAFGSQGLPRCCRCCCRHSCSPWR